MKADNYGILHNPPHLNQTYCIVVTPSDLDNRVSVHYRGIWYKKRYMRLL